MATCEDSLKNRPMLYQGLSNFVKILIDSEFSEVLCLPLEIAQGVKGLVLQEIMLEDLSQTFWTVTLSEYNGKVAFCKGWPEFSKDMNLEIGDALVFYYIKKGHFFVLAFDSDGCEKKYTPRRHPSSNRSLEINANDISNRDEDGKHKQHCMDEECLLMINRDDGYHQSDYNKCVLYDLPSFEMPQTACTTSVTRKGRDGSSKDKNPSETTILNDRSAINLAPIANVSQSLAMGSQSPPKTSKRKLDESTSVRMVGRNTSEFAPMNKGWSPLTKEKGDSSAAAQMNKGQPLTMREQEDNSFAATLGNNDQLPSMREEVGSFFAVALNKVVKITPVDPIYVPSSTVNRVTCLAKTNGGYLIKNLPSSLPSITFENGIGEASIILRDPRGKAWESTYHEKDGLRSLAASWPVINAENNIEPGDRLVISLVDSRSNEYKFDIVRNPVGN